jgi:hypothetical protein
MRSDPAVCVALRAKDRISSMNENPREFAAVSLRGARERIGSATEKLLTSPVS